MRRTYVLAAVSIVLIVAWTASAAPLALARATSISSHIAAFPRITAPRDEVSARINAALAPLDLAALRVAAECLGEARRAGAAGGDWGRTVVVTMKGPRLLSFLVTDSYFCGGAHPDVEAWPLVFDLSTGQPVDWTRFLPRALLGKATTDIDPDTAGRISLASPGLHTLYMAGYGAQARVVDPECRDVMADSDAAVASIWPDAANGGLMVDFDVPHVVAACAVPVVIPVAHLKALGASPDLTAALTAARASR
ncbi:MAG TPA: hypothetical protein VG166_06165 [Caulobacteraceae bacterium]|nr:hypothetical protein [Caulobacteraceae bacterium]